MTKYVTLVKKLIKEFATSGLGRLTKRTIEGQMSCPRQ